LPSLNIALKINPHFYSEKLTAISFNYFLGLKEEGRENINILTKIQYSIMNFIQRLFRSLFGTRKIEKIVIIDPERLHQIPQDKAYSKKYQKYKKTYYYGQSGGTNLIEAQRRFLEKGRKVKCWRLVLSHSDFSMDEYVPIFSKGRKSKSHKNKRHKGRGNRAAQRKRTKLRKKNR